MISIDINEDEIYEQVMIEVEQDNKVKSTWAKALSQSDGDDKKAQSLYIKLRVDTLIQERKEQIELERKKIEEQELLIKQEVEKLEQQRLEKKRLEKKRLENERKEQERVEQEKLEEEKRIQREKDREEILKSNQEIAKSLKKAFIGIIIILITYFSYDQLTDIYSVEKQLKNGDKYYIKTFEQDYKKALNSQKFSFETKSFCTYWEIVEVVLNFENSV